MIAMSFSMNLWKQPLYCHRNWLFPKSWGTPKSSKIGPCQYGNLPNLQTKGHEWHQLPSPSEETCKDFGTGKKIGFHTLFDPPMVCSTSLVVTFMNRFTSDGLRLSEIGSTGPDISIFGMAKTSFFWIMFLEDILGFWNPFRNLFQWRESLGSFASPDPVSLWSRSTGAPFITEKSTWGIIIPATWRRRCIPQKRTSPMYPLVMTNIAIENGHRNSGFTHWKWCFSIVMLVYQRVLGKAALDQFFWVRRRFLEKLQLRSCSTWVNMESIRK